MSQAVRAHRFSAVSVIAAAALTFGALSAGASPRRCASGQLTVRVRGLSAASGHAYREFAFVNHSASGRVPVSRRERPAKPALSRESIVAAAAGIIDAEGHERLTVRRLATALDTGAASLYVYFRNTEQLHAAVLDQLLGTVNIRAQGATWRERLVAVLVSYTEVLYEHPGLARTAMFTRPSEPNSLNVWEALLGLLDEGGSPVGEAAWGADLLLQAATATAAEHGSRDAAGAGADQDIAAQAIRGAPPATHPHIDSHRLGRAALRNEQ
jgi:AcrR family transcriptional regulator